MEVTEPIEVKKAMHVIQILGCDTNTGDLILSDKAYSEVGICVWITWLIHPNSGVRNIFAINAKPDNPNVFQIGAYKLGHSSNWRGQIRCDFKEIIEEDYDMVWEDYDGNIHTYDPRIRVNPDL